MNFPVYNIRYEARSTDMATIVKGDMKNDSMKNFTFIMFRVILYDRQKSLGSGILKLYDFRVNNTKFFEVVVDMNRALIPRIVKYEILFENGY